MDIISFDQIRLDAVRGVLIDLDNTLYTYDPCHEVGVEEAHNASMWDVTIAEFAKAYRDAREIVVERLKPQAACRSRLFAFQIMCEARKVPQPYNLAVKLEKTYWDSLITSIRPDTGALGFLKKCKEIALPVCLVSDMTAQIQIRKLEQLGVSSYIDYMVTSEEVGAEKPDARMFKAGLSKIGCTTNDTIMIGDDLKKDIEGAMALGIQAYWVKAVA